MRKRIEIKKKESFVIKLVSKTMLYTRVHIHKRESERTFILTGALKQSVPIFSIEFLQEIQILLEKQDSTIDPNPSQHRAHGENG